ncbi:DNA (cytosine-5-)-methyltransferase 3 beta, duplicate a [Fundulus heteroclitus]|uniref:DNA (cytosine-5-)-methyltransferase 3 beta, duplicate a n=1 Tax=Fundulus heteroclitus TaxID=8078 RepID=UPI00165B43C1|nr:DNA (cytosine-5-)-methyltransferase 3 beta, duplicate a [Fundulus heteroclitus]XP_035996949.1 DNA (cytosine-5-)-methyltransferase 3 beta, duplicate a [Fundulus heteroclitus]
MADPLVVIPNASQDKSSRFYVVSWINKLLKTNFKDVREMGSGACQCQMMDCTFPGSVDLTKVKFDAQSTEDFRHNFSLLQDAFKQKDITKTIPIEELTKGDFQTCYEFMKWFKVFHTANAISKDYDPLKARNNKDITPISISSESGNSDRETNGSTTPTKGFPYTETWKEDFDWADWSPLGERHTYCSSCHTNLSTYVKGVVELQRHMETNKHKKRAKHLQSSQRKSQLTKPFPCSDAAIRFIYNRCYTGSAKGEQAPRHFARCKLGLKYPKDLIAVSKHTPYCVYVYEGLTAGVDDTVTVVLLRFFDSESSTHRIRFLDAFQAADGDGDQTATAVVETLKKFELSTYNLAACYVGEGEASEQIRSRLRELNPNIIAFGGLYAIADAAYHAGVTELSSQVQELVVDLYAHCSSCSAKNDNLKALFGSDITKHSSPFYLSISCLRFHQLITKMLEMWSDLILYHSSCPEDCKKAKSLCSQLKDPKVKATIMFLEQALKPLQKFQKQIQESSWTDMPLILEEASALLGTYTSRFLQQNAAARYLKDHDAQILKNKKFHLSGDDFNLGGRAVRDFLQGSEAAESVPQLQEEVLPFYVAVAGCIAEELPLSDTVLRSIAQVLNPQSSLTVAKAAVEELGSKLGVCNTPEEVRQLKKEYSEYLLAEEGKSKEGVNEDTLETPLARVLKSPGSAPLFRKLVLTLLSFPCPPLDAHHVLSQALDTNDDCSETDTFVESECEALSDGVLTNNGSKNLQVLANGLNGLFLKPCEVRLTKINDLCDDIMNGSLSNEGSWRGGHGWESSLRRKPPARKVFQAGVCTWSKPIGKNDPESLNEVLEGMSPSRKGTPSRARHSQYQDGKAFPVGELVWGKLSGMSMWPGLVMDWKSKHAPPGVRRVEWFGDGMFSEISTERLKPFSSFTLCFCKNSFASLPVYREAIYHICELAAERCGKTFDKAKGDKEKELKLMVEWASEGFLPTGPRGFAVPDPSSNQDSNDSASPDYQPPAKRKHALKNREGGHATTHNRDSLKEKVKEEGKTIEHFCLSCASPEIKVQHPLFEGGLCHKCKENFTETLYRYDEDGYQSYCTICCGGLEVILCENSSCCRCFCKDCLEILVAEGTFEKLKKVDPWICFMCEPSKCDGHLKVRPDWSVKVQDLFANNSAMEFESHRVYPSIPADRRKPLKVLSLFDGIATGYLVLRDLGFKIERYIASEICDDSIVVGMVKHEGKIEYVNDVRTITRKHLAEWGPFDLLIGGSPCNDLSMVNPLRKGLYEGTGRLFFEFYRILTLLRPKEEDDRPFFWLFENVVFMNAHDKNDICRFLECNPVLVDAIKVSPAHRARYFWGNIPGMSRPLSTSLDDKVTLQDCLEAGRMAKFEKVRTITTKSNSIRQGKTGPLPVLMNGKEDYLWCTEMEQIFGFPKHYTDVNNMGRMQRQKVLGRSWSVPVIRHLLAPLKDYFECE